MQKSRYNIDFLTVLNNSSLVFSAQNKAYGNELWITDGTTENTHILKDIAPGAISSDPGGLKKIGDSILFYADDSSGVGKELWKTNGTAEGTQLVRDMNPGGSTSQCTFLDPQGQLLYDSTSFIAVGNLAFFAADDGITRCELWSSDGTPEGTVRHGDIDPNNNDPDGGGYPNLITKISDNVIAFRANDGNQAPGHGTELWLLRRK